MQKTMGLLIGLACSSHSYAQNVTLGTPEYGGTGCPAGTVATVLSPDKTSLSVLFDQYVAEAGRDVNRRFDRKSCNVAIPVRVPQGYTVSILKIDYRGYNSLPRGAQSSFNVEYFFAGGRGPSFQRNFNGPLDSDYLISNRLLAESVVWSACGQSVILRTNTSLRATTNSRQEQTLATVDTQDVEAAVIYQLQWKRCR